MSHPSTFTMPAAFLAAAIAMAQPLNDAPWGDEARGLRARVTLDADDVADAGPLVIHYEVQNVSDKPLTVWRRGFWPNHRIDVAGPDGEPATRTALGDQKRRAFLDPGAIEKSAPHTIDPGAIDDAYEPYDLRELFTLEAPGEYTLRVLYQESAETPPVESNELRFHIKNERGP
jgi:hypothetical protein